MPLFYFVCPVCHQPDRRMLDAAEADKPRRCRKKLDCGGTLERDVQEPSMSQKEVIDNGVLTKRIETYTDIDKLVKERNQTDYRKHK